MKLDSIRRRFTPHSLTWGRMRYAPTVIRLKSNEYQQNTSSKIFRIIISGRQSTPHSPPWGRMRYAPTLVRSNSNGYHQNTSSKNCCFIIHWRRNTTHSPLWGRMRYDLTPVRWISNISDQILKWFVGTFFGWLGGMMYICRWVPRSMTDGRGLTVFG